MSPGRDAGIEIQPKADAAVVIDVLRATTTIAWALHNGAEAVQAFADLEDLRRCGRGLACRQASAPWGNAVGRPCRALTWAIHPWPCTPDGVAGKRLFMSTTNGTRALDRKCGEVPLLLTAALPNREAVAQRLLQETIPEPSWPSWAVAGRAAYSLEDSLAAGALAASPARSWPW